MNTPLVSIIIPIYNSAKYLAKTIASATGQTWPNKEIIIVDDGSTDDSLAIAKSFANKQVKVFSQTNKGASAARNKGLQEAKGEYIQFLDADDLLMPNKITSQLQQLTNKPNTLAICPVADFYTDDTISSIPLKKQTVPFALTNDNQQFLLDLYDVENYAAIVPIHSWLTPSSIIKKVNRWNESLTVNDDGEFFCRVVLASDGIETVNNTLCYYRKYKAPNSSLSGRKDELSLNSQYNSLLLINDHLKSVKNDDKINKVITQNLAVLLMQAYPAHKALANIIANKIRELGGSDHSPVLGGKIIEGVKKLLGWKTARLLQFYFKKITKN